MATPTVPGDARAALRSLGWLGIATLIAGGIALAAQQEVAPRASYAWYQPLLIIRNVFAGPIGPTWVAIATLLGWAARPAGLRGVARDHLAAIPRRHTLFMVALATLVAAGDFALNDAHRGPDVASVFLLAFALLAGARANSGQARLANAIEVALALGVFVAVSYTFTVFKAALFQLQDPKDALLVAAERTLFGTPPHRLAAAAAARTPALATFADDVYDAMFHHMFAVTAFLSALGRAAERRRYLTALCVAYLAGGILYHFLPALGPVYFEPESYAFLRRLPLRTNIYQATLQQTTMEAARGEILTLATYAYIAAMPSLHLAHETVMLWYARASRPFFAFSLAFYLATIFAVLALGWHYALDVVAGFALGAGAIALAERYAATAFPRLAPAAEPTPSIELEPN